MTYFLRMFILVALVLLSFGGFCYVLVAIVHQLINQSADGLTLAGYLLAASLYIYGALQFITQRLALLFAGSPSQEEYRTQRP